MNKLKIFTDGGSRGNPGEAAIGIVIINKQDGRKITELSKCIGVATNNIAEYTAVLEALSWIEENVGESELNFILDSELVVKQLSGSYKIRNDKLKPIYFKIKEKIIGLGGISTFTHVLREKNREADALVNKALDH